MAHLPYEVQSAVLNHIFSILWMWTGLTGKSHYYTHENFKDRESSNMSEIRQIQIMREWVLGVRHVVVLPEKEMPCTIDNTGFRFSPVIHKTCLFTAFTMSGACLLAAEYSTGTNCGDIMFQVLQIWSHCGTSYQHWRTYCSQTQ
jgi:hypothetical protein